MTEDGNTRQRWHQSVMAHEDSETRIETWRNTVLRRSQWLALALGAAIAGINYSQNGFAGIEFMVHALPGWALVVTSLTLKSVRTSIRAWLFFSGFMLVIIEALHRSGFLAPNAFVAAVYLGCVAGLILRPKAAWLAAGLTTAAIIPVAVGYTSGWTIENSQALDVSRAENWIRVVSNFTILNGATVAAVLYVVSRLEKALAESESLYRALKEESEERLRAVREQLSLEARLQHAQRLESLGSLTGGVAHDFNNLLHIISESVTVADDPSATPADSAQALKDISDAAKRATGLTQQLLALSRKQPLETISVDVEESVRSSTDLLRRLLPTTIQLKTHISNDLPRIHAVPTAVSQIIMNLTINARDAMKEGGQIEVDVSRARTPSESGAGPGDFVLIRVRDSGPGMDAETLAEAFEPFFTTKPAGQGTGLGLSLVKSLATQSGGFVELDSHLGQGTRIDVYLRSVSE